MAVTTRPDWATELIDLLDDQRRIYVQLHELSQEQTHLVEAGEAEPLLTLLSKRQQLIDRLTQLNGRMEPFRRNWPTLWSELSDAKRTTVQSLIDQVQGLLDKIVNQDERDRAALSAQRERVGQALSQVKVGTNLNRAYGGPASPGSSRYTDQRG